MPHPTRPPADLGEALLIVSSGPLTPSLRGAVAQLQTPGLPAPAVVAAGDTAPSAPGGHGLGFFLPAAADDAALDVIARLVRDGWSLVVVASGSDNAWQLEALRRGAGECLGAADEAALIASAHRVLARASHTRHDVQRATLFRTLVERDADGLAIVDQDLIVRYVSEVGATRLGEAREALLGIDGLTRLHPDDLEAALATIGRAIEDPTTHAFETIRLRHHDGSWRDFDATAISMLDDPAVRGLVLTFRDVTERQRRLRDTAETEARYRQIAESVPVHVWMDDPQHGLIYENRTAEEFSGRPLLDEIGSAWHDQIHPDDLPTVLATYAATSANPVPYQILLRLRRADGVYRWIYEIGVPRYDANGALTGFIGVDVDVHELKEASLRVEETETRYRNFIAHSTEGIWRFENETPLPIDLPEEEQLEQFLDHSYLAECNFAMAAMYGFDRPEELVGMRLSEFVPPSDRHGLDAFLRAYIRSGYRLSDAESLEHDRHGRPRYFLNNLVGVVRDGHLLRSWGTQRDITDRRHLEEEARQARKMETAGRLAGGIAHDFNNLLTAILGTSEILLQELPESAPARFDVEEIKRAATRAANLTRQLLAFSRRQVLQPRILDAAAVVHGVETMLRRLIGEHITLTTRGADDLWRVRADPGQLEQVVINLCVNARDAMPTGGTLRIDLDNVDFPGAATGAESIMPAGAYVCLTVSDSGSGMSAETLEHLFEPFYTTKEPGKGTGLGLATVYGIVKQSGGFIFAESEPGRGSRFRTFLPRVSGPLAEGEHPAAELPARRAEGTILLVEDEEAVRRLAQRVLEGVGYRLLVASSGAEALAMAAAHAGPIDLMVTDVIMPGMSGQELSTRLRALRPDLPILYVSGYTDDAILQHGTLLPNTTFLQKPFTAVALAQRVHEGLRG